MLFCVGFLFVSLRLLIINFTQWNAFYEDKLIWSHTILLEDGRDQLFYIDRAEDLPDEGDVVNTYETEL